MRKLDDIIPPSRRRDFEMPGAPQKKPPEPLNLSPRGSGFPYRTAIVAVVVIIAAVGGLFYFSSAKVDITPASSSISVTGSFTATQGQGTIPFEVISAQKVAVQSVQGSGTKTVTQPASGSVTVYNAQSKAQTLVANTRFATKSGLIFRIHSGISVPAGSASAPGTVQATVYADQAGDSYNVDATSFTLPGLSGTPQFAQVYAKSIAPMSGGASGAVPVVGTAAETTARTALVSALQGDLTNELKGEVPEGYILLPGAATSTFTAQTSAPSSTTGMVDIKEQGTISAVVFPETALAGAVATQTLGGAYNGEPVTFASASGLILSSAITPVSDLQTYAFSLSGPATLVYSIDSSRIAAAIAGKTRASAEVALSSYPEIKRAVLILRPFWRQSFPEDPSSITVVTEKP